MEESVEKSCWSVTLWAVVAVVGFVLIGSFVTGGDATIVASTASAVQ